jgi:transcriptional regulator with GAF, ATPase, and Fis domain
MGRTELGVQLVRFLGCEVPAGLCEELAMRGLTLGDSGPELVLFERFDAELPALFAGGQSLAIALNSDALRHGTVPLLRGGALDVLDAGSATWAERAYALLEHRARIDQLLESPLVRQNIAGSSRRFRDTLRRLVELSQTEASVLLGGETGTGKELMARLLHGLDPREKKGALVVLDCTTLVAELSGSELFGHERGAFTGALTAREGVIAQAENGTLFLDEIGELPLSLQAQLLRVIQERSYRRVGSDNWRNSSFRLVCATHRDLETEVQQGRFRADLFYRLAGSSVRLPNLRERPGDVVPLARFFLREVSKGRYSEFDRLVEDHLASRAFPGNVRELRQLVGRSFHRWVGPGPLGYSSLPEEEWSVQAVDLERELEPALRKALAARLGLKEIGHLSRELTVKLAIEDAGGNLQRAAELLGVTDRALQLRRAQKFEA